MPAATLYYLLTGQHIDERSGSMLDLLQRILDQEPIPLRDPAAGPPLPGRLGAVLRRALSRDPARRYPDAAAMRHELSRAL
jgi:serine/threonine-protein kinase